MRMNRRKLYLLMFALLYTFIVTCGFAQAAQAAPETVADAHAVVDVQTGRILASKNGDTPMEMASTTKVMTALLAVESGRLDEVVTIPPEASGVEGSSIYLKPGEQFTLRALTYGLMLRSGNDAAEAIAIHLAGGVEQFSGMMNEKARALGCNNTNFTNPHGLHADNHYTTANDLAIITAYAMRNADFREIVSTKYTEVDPSGEGEHRVFQNKNKLLWNFDGATGVKTGYTKDSGKCLVGSAERNGTHVVAVVLNCSRMWDDTMALMEDALASYGMTEVVADGTAMGDLPVAEGQGSSVRTALVGSYTMPLGAGEIEQCEVKAELPASLKAPVRQGDIVGTAKIYFAGVEYAALDIVACEDVHAEGFLYRLHQVIGKMIGL